MKKALLAALLFGGLSLLPTLAQAQEAPPLPDESWSFTGFFGTYNVAALQRGFQVYEQVCSACHNLDHLHYYDLAGIGYDEAEIKAIAAQKKVLAGPNKEGKMYKRPARPSDFFVGPFPNAEAAKASFGGAEPPDLSTIIKARDGGADYVYGILTGFGKPPHGFAMPPGTFYDKYFPGQRIHMPPPLQAGEVKFADGTKATVPQMAHDVATFLTWASHPNLDERHRMGFKVILFLVVAAFVFYGAKRKIWSRIH